MPRFIYCILLFFFTCCTLSAGDFPRTVISFDEGWKFILGNDSLAFNPAFDDSKWRTLNLPHDWSIEGSFSKDNPTKPEEGALPAGIGWYRKKFTLPSGSVGKSIFIDFDGVYRNSEVWINGHYLGKRPNGYISFRYELTPYLNFGKGNNVVAVKVDNSEQPNSRWYTGSGIYRHVWLVTTGKIHVDHWGTFITTPEINADRVKVKFSLSIACPSGVSKSSRQGITAITILYNAQNKEIARNESQNIAIMDSMTVLNQDFQISKPLLWSVNTPYLYHATTTLYVNNQPEDSYTTPFGIRYFRFDAQKGFFLNGKPLKILGVCNHHDLGALGAVVNTRAIERQLEILKAMGCNAIRTSHNPPATELLDLCDKMGFIVMDEAFDCWKKKKVSADYHLYWDKWHETDLRDQIKRDRNHPSVFMWSIGNEIREQFDTSGIRIAKELIKTVKSLDTTRVITSALTETDPAKNFIYQSKGLDLLGFNYKHDTYADFPKNYPGQAMIASETMSALATRGHYDMPSDSIRRWPKDAKTPLTGGNADFTASAYDNASAYWGSTHEETWKVVKKYPFISGLYIWTGFDYLGEPTPYPWPARSSYFGILDLAGFPKDAYYLYQSEWTTTPVLHIFPHWNWTPGKTIDVWAYYSNADEVELFLNNRSLGIRKKTGDQMHVMWHVPYNPGTLKAISRKNGKIVLTREIKTSGQAAKIELIADRTKIKADGEDLAFITVNILDKNGNLVPDAANLIKFNVSNASIAGVDNGYEASLEPFKADYRKAFNGKCLLIVRSGKSTEEIKIQAASKGLKTAIISISENQDKSENVSSVNDQ